MLIGLSYLILVYGLYVPDWFFEISSLNMESRSPVSGYRLSTQTVRIFLKSFKILVFSDLLYLVAVKLFPFQHYTSAKLSFYMPYFKFPRSLTLQ